jgi:hypothetical protein
MVRSKTLPGLMVPSITSGSSSSMYALAGATPPVSVMLRMNSRNPSGTSENWGAHGFKDDVRSVAVREFLDPGNALLAALGDDVGGTEFAAEFGAGHVPAHEDDARGAHQLGGKNGGEADGAVTDHGDGLAGLDAGLLGGVVAGRHDIGEAQQ